MINTLKWWILSLKVAHESVISSRRHNLDRIVWLDDTSLPPWISFVPCAQLPAYHAASHPPHYYTTKYKYTNTNTQIQSSGTNYQLITRHRTISTPLLHHKIQIHKYKYKWQIHKYNPQGPITSLSRGITLLPPQLLHQHSSVCHNVKTAGNVRLLE